MENEKPILELVLMASNNTTPNMYGVYWDSYLHKRNAHDAHCRPAPYSLGFVSCSLLSFDYMAPQCELFGVLLVLALSYRALKFPCWLYLALLFFLGRHKESANRNQTKDNFFSKANLHFGHKQAHENRLSLLCTQKLSARDFSVSSTSIGKIDPP